MTVAAATKVCSKCGEEKPREAFHKAKQNKDGLMGFCGVCRNEKHKGQYQRWTPEQREKHRARVLKCRYGMTLEELEAMYQMQAGCCAVCEEPGDRPAINEKRASNAGVLCVDHDHATGAVRGLLCRACNQGIGQFRDDAEAIVRAAAYVLKGGVV